MKGERVATGLLIALVGGLVVAGLVLVGGPGTAQKIRRDEMRMSGLQNLEQCLIAQIPGRKIKVPQRLEETTCGQGDDGTDPFTGKPYRYERRSDTSFAVCADFEIKGRQYPNWQSIFDSDSGCLITEIFVE